MTLGRRYKKRPQRTITTRAFKSNTDLLNKLTNSDQLPHSTEMQSNMAANSSSANNNQFQENLIGTSVWGGHILEREEWTLEETLFLIYVTIN